MSGNGVTGDAAPSAAALLDRKLRLAEALSCRDLFSELEAVDAAIEQAMRDRLELDAQLVVAEAQLAEHEALLALQVESKNETERKAKRAQLLAEDATHQELVGQVRDLERRKGELDLRLETLRRKARRLERGIEYRVAALRMLGG